MVLFRSKILSINNKIFLFRGCATFIKEYLQQSSLATDHFQKSLPKLPIPKLESTCERFLKVIQPLVDKEQFEETTKVIENFLSNEGPYLQSKLISYDKRLKHTSYIADIWHQMYWSDRRPLPINFNPYLVFKPDPPHMHQALRATNLIVSCLRMRRSLRENVLEPELYGRNVDENFKTNVRRLPRFLSTYYAHWHKIMPLNVSTHKYLFNSCRIPRKGMDQFQIDPNNKQITVVCRGIFYVFDAVQDDGNMLNPEKIFENIQYILNDSIKPTDSSNNYNDVGYFTSLNRDEWADARDKLRLLGNAENIDSIEKSIILICLDDEEDKNDKGKMIKSFLIGNGANRWFDKSVSVIVKADATAGINFEHSWGDGVAMLRFFEEVYKDSTCNPSISSPPTKPSNLPSRSIKKLRWKLTSDLSEKLSKAKVDYDDKSNSVVLNVMQENSIKKSLLKNIDADSFVQLAFLVAYNEYKGGETVHKGVEDLPILPTAYESCSTAMFKHGRTETLRPATKEIQEAIKILASTDTSEAIDAIQRCSLRHSKLVREARMGQGIDRHLQALKAMAGDQVPLLFTHHSYLLLQQNIISSSTLSSNSIYAGGFAPTFKDAIGIGYQLTDEGFMATLCCHLPHNNIQSYIHALKNTFEKLKKLLEKK